MTIDESKTQLSMQKFYVLGKDYEAVQVAIDTMNKYQKIEQILDDYDLEAWEVLEKIKEVIKDGNDN